MSSIKTAEMHDVNILHKLLLPQLPPPHSTTSQTPTLRQPVVRIQWIHLMHGVTLWQHLLHHHLQRQPVLTILVWPPGVSLLHLHSQWRTLPHKVKVHGRSVAERKKTADVVISEIWMLPLRVVGSVAQLQRQQCAKLRYRVIQNWRVIDDGSLLVHHRGGTVGTGADHVVGGLFDLRHNFHRRGTRLLLLRLIDIKGLLPLGSQFRNSVDGECSLAAAHQLPVLLRDKMHPESGQVPAQIGTRQHVLRVQPCRVPMLAVTVGHWTLVAVDGARNLKHVHVPIVNAVRFKTRRVHFARGQLNDGFQLLALVHHAALVVPASPYKRLFFCDFLRHLPLLQLLLAPLPFRVLPQRVVNHAPPPPRPDILLRLDSVLFAVGMEPRAPFHVHQFKYGGHLCRDCALCRTLEQAVPPHQCNFVRFPSFFQQWQPYHVTRLVVLAAVVIDCRLSGVLPAHFAFTLATVVVPLPAPFLVYYGNYFRCCCCLFRLHNDGPHGRLGV